jgi:spore coat protein A
VKKCNTDDLTGLGDVNKLTDILLPFKTQLPLPNTISFIEDDAEKEECSKTIKIKKGTATLYKDTSRGIKIQVPIWGYEGKFLGPTLVMSRDQRVVIDWVNAVPDTSRQPSVAVKVAFENTDGEIVPQNILGNPEDSEMTMGHGSAAYFSPHQHGGKTAPSYDGGPEDLIRYKQNHLNQYENHQRAAMLWYHDHAMHTTRLNVFSGLAGLWIIRDEEEEKLHLPCGDYEIPLVIQDRNLTTLAEGSELLHKVEFGEGPLEFFGPLTLVNGVIWPVKEVKSNWYRLRLLNGANSRAYRLIFTELDCDGNYTECTDIVVKQIGSDGGLMNTVVDLPTNGLAIAPAERVDLLVDFSSVSGKEIVLLNTAESPFANEAPPATMAELFPPYPALDGRRTPYPEVMMFKVSSSCDSDANDIDLTSLNNKLSTLPSYDTEKPNFDDVTKVRTVAIVEKETADGAVLVLWELMPKNEVMSESPILIAGRCVNVDGVDYVAVAERYHDPVSIIIPEGSTERWRFVNLTADTHPMHVHLVQFLPIMRQNINTINGINIDRTPTATESVGDQILGEIGASIGNNTSITLTTETLDDSNINANLDANEQCLKDTVRVNPGEMVDIIARFEEHHGRYVYHCHLLEHEDHDMMRQFIVTRNDLHMMHMLPVSVKAKDDCTPDTPTP